MLCFKLLNRQVAEDALVDLLHAIRNTPEAQNMDAFIKAQRADRYVMNLPAVDLRTCPLEVLTKVLVRPQKRTEYLLSIFDDYILRASFGYRSPGRALLKVYGTAHWRSIVKWLRPVGAWPFVTSLLLVIARLAGGEISVNRGGIVNGYFGNRAIRITPEGVFWGVSRTRIDLPPSLCKQSEVVFPATNCKHASMKAVAVLLKGDAERMLLTLLNHALNEGIVTLEWIEKHFVGPNSELAKMLSRNKTRAAAFKGAYEQALFLINIGTAQAMSEAFGVTTPVMLTWDQAYLVFGFSPSSLQERPNKRFQKTTLEAIRGRLKEAYEEELQRL